MTQLPNTSAPAQTETTALNSVAVLQRALKASRLCVWQLELPSETMHLSEAWSERLGGPSCVTLTQLALVEARVPEPDLRMSKALMLPVLQGKSHRYVCEHRVRRDDGSIMWILAEGEVAERDSNGRATLLVGTNRDITQSKLEQESLQVALKHMSQGLMRYDKNKCLTLFNSQALAFLDLPTASISLGMPFEELLKVQLQSRTIEMQFSAEDANAAEFLRQGNMGFKGDRTLYVRTNQRSRTLQIETLPMDDGGWLRTITDITTVEDEREKRNVAAKQLAEKSTQLALILEHTSHGIVLLDSDLRVVAYNPKVLEMLALPDVLMRTRPSQRELFDFQFDRGDLETKLSRDQAWEKYFGSGQFGEFQNSYRRKTAGGQFIDVKTMPLSQGGWVRTYADVTPYMRTEMQLRSSAGLLQSVLDAALDVGIMAAGMDRKITLFNKGAERLLGYTSDEVVGIHTKELFRDMNELAESQASMSAQLGSPVTSNDVTVHPTVLGAARDWTYVRKGGQRIPVSVTITERRDENGDLLGYLAMARDISAQRAHELRLTQARETAEDATRAKSAFLATMSHEIRTPMNGVIGMTSLLLETSLSPEQLEFTEVIRASGEGLLVVINDILDFSKIESGQMHLEQAPFSVLDCVESCIDILTLTALSKKLDLLCKVEPNVPRWIYGDLTRLRQVLMNLVSNALKFTEHGDVLVSVRRIHPEQENPICIEFEVSDTGIGIAPEQMQHLFLPFSQLDTSTTRKYGGTGLGLAISKRLVESMGGQLSVTSVLSRGAQFVFSILTQPAAAQVAPNAAKNNRIDPTLAGYRVMLIDDNITNARVLALQLSGWGISHVAFSDATTALAHLQRDCAFDLVITDMYMPGMDGITFGQTVHAQFAQLRIALLTSVDIHRQAETLLFSAVLTKPVRQSALFTMLIELLLRRPPVHVASETGETLGHAPSAVGEARVSVRVLDASMGVRLPLQILLAEDNETNQKLALRMLAGFGYPADIATNGLEVIEACRRQQYDLIFMDVQMPEMDGLEATRKIKAEWPSSAQPRIVVMSANALPEDLQRAALVGVDGYITKPISLQAIKAALEEWGTEKARKV